MKKITLSLAAAALALLSPSPAAPRPEHRESFLPVNDLKHRIGALDSGGVTEAEFNAVMNRLQALYGPAVAARGGTLVINRLWTDDTVNASAEQENGNWIINMYGGLARDKAITQDGLALVACHEMGHHLGGAPKWGDSAWASNEGEADYFANAKCLHRFFGDEATASFTRPRLAASNDLALAAAACAKSYQSAKEQAVCARSAAAGQSVTALFTEIGAGAPSHFDTPDASVVARTNDDHPAPQCRLDTYYQASLCPKDFRIDLSDVDPAVGACVLSQGYAVGMRPLCWYKPAANEIARQRRASVAAASAALASLKSANVLSGL